jgi:hypothetical protein
MPYSLLKHCANPCCILYIVTVRPIVSYTQHQVLYLEAVPSHALLILAYEVGAFLLRIVRGREEHALVALCLLIGADTACCSCQWVLAVTVWSLDVRFTFAGAPVFFKSEPMLAAVGGARSLKSAVDALISSYGAIRT